MDASGGLLRSCSIFCCMECIVVIFVLVVYVCLLFMFLLRVNGFVCGIYWFVLIVLLWLTGRVGGSGGGVILGILQLSPCRDFVL